MSNIEAERLSAKNRITRLSLDYKHGKIILKLKATISTQMNSIKSKLNQNVIL